MTIPSAKYLKVKAANRLSEGKEPKKVVLTYAGIIAGSSLIVNAVKYLLDGQIDQTGGLQNIGTRSMLSTASTVLTIVQMLLVMCIALGYTAAMLRIARGQYASSSTLKAGVERLWVLLRTRLLQLTVYFSVCFALCLLLVNVYMMTPLSNSLVTALLPLAESGITTAEALLESELFLSAASEAMMPLMIAYIVVLLPVLWLLVAMYRLSDYLLIDQPQLGALGALRESRKRMRGNLKMLLRIDFSFWWYYLLQVVVGFLVYLDVILALCGIQLPLSNTAYFFVVVLIYLAADFAVRYFFSNRVNVTYALFYDHLCPKKEESGAVLGNIFEM